MLMLTRSRFQLSAFVIVIILDCCVIGGIYGCPKTPNVIHGRRTRGDNGYKLLIGNSPLGYTPGKTYNCKYIPSVNFSKEYLNLSILSVDLMTGLVFFKIAS